MRAGLLTVPLAVAITTLAPMTAQADVRQEQGWGCAAGEVQCPETRTFASTGAEQTYVVPAGVEHLKITATGAHGGYGDGPVGAGGRGARVQAVVAVTPGQQLYVLVGSDGTWWQDDNVVGDQAGGFNGGGAAPDYAGSGGGASDVRTVSASSPGTLASRLVVAGGGGGGGGSQPGGDAGTDGSALQPGTAGAAGAAEHGGAGGQAMVGGPGAAGTAGAGGRGGEPVAMPMPAAAGGAGGGGWYGGGGGAAGSGGGGGSSLVPVGGTGPTPSSDPAGVTISALIAPQITAAVAPAATWSTQPARVTFTCAPGTAPIVTCPEPVTVPTDGRHDVTGTVTDADGLTSRVTVPVAVDRTGPTITVRGVRDGMTYANPHRARCVATDPLSGVASCATSEKAVRHGRRTVTTVTVTATDRAGNQRVETLRYVVRRARTYLVDAPALGGVYRLQPGVRYPLVALTDGRRPVATDPLTGRPLTFREDGTARGLVRWRAVLTPRAELAEGTLWTLRIRVGDQRRVLRFTKDRVPVS
jgi:hypothetical protein